MVVTNHPLASAAGAQMLASGGNAIDATMASLFALTVVEPMMIGLLGGGIEHVRLSDGRQFLVDSLCTAPAASRPDMFRPTRTTSNENYDAEGRENTVGPKAVAVPGALAAWVDTLQRFGTMSLADIIEPAIRYASQGFAISPYLAACIGDAAPDLARDPVIAQVLLPNGAALQAGAKLVTSAYADSLRFIAQHGASALHVGPLGDAMAQRIAQDGGVLTTEDLASYRIRERNPLLGTYRDREVAVPPPPAGSGIHLLQMLNILEGYDLKQSRFGSVKSIHYLAEAMKIAFADRGAVAGDPDFTTVPVDRLISKEYAAERRALISKTRAQSWNAGMVVHQSPHTTHVTVADRLGNVVSSTQTISALFGARFMIPGTGMIPNNYMASFDPRPGNPMSITAGKRVTTSMCPTFIAKDGRIQFALGAPGGKRIFPSLLQALVNIIDHGMGFQAAFEAPRIFTEGGSLEVERAIPETIQHALRSKGHPVMVVPHVGGGINGIHIDEYRQFTGAACWRADGTAIALGGGLARPGVRFWPDRPTS
jgi:gamma-glutamyltranspeptidase / glutathione hydrolase